MLHLYLALLFLSEKILTQQSANSTDLWLAVLVRDANDCFMSSCQVDSLFCDCDSSSSQVCVNQISFWPKKLTLAQNCLQSPLFLFSLFHNL